MGKRASRGSNGRFVRREDSPDVPAEALRLRAQGFSYGRIADRMKISKSTAYEIVQAAYAAVVQDTAPVALAIELDRLDDDFLALSTLKARLVRRVVPDHHEDGQGLAPDDRAAELLVKTVRERGRISEQRSRLRGLAAPATIRVETEESAGIPLATVLDRIAAAVRPFPDAAAAVSLVLFELREALLSDDGPES